MQEAYIICIWGVSVGGKVNARQKYSPPSWLHQGPVLGMAFPPVVVSLAVSHASFCTASFHCFNIATGSLHGNRVSIATEFHLTTTCSLFRTYVAIVDSLNNF